MARTYRLQVPMKPETRKAFEDYAEVMGLSTAQAASKLMDEVAPALVDLSAALKKAQGSPAKALRQTALMMHKYVDEADQIAMELEKASKGKRKK